MTPKTNMHLPLILCTAAAPLLPVDEVQFAPAKGTAVQKTFTQSATLEASTADIVVPDEEGPIDVELTLEWERELVFTDTFLESADGRPAKLRRAFDSLQHDAEYLVAVEAEGFSDEDENGVNGGSELEGRVVEFTRDGDEVEVDWADDKEGDEQLLAGLTLGADLTALLPDGDVDKGDRWDLDGNVLYELLVPSGDLGFELSFVEEERAMEFTAVGLEPAFFSLAEHLVGEPDDADATATYQGTREVDGRRVAVIALTLEVTTERDATDSMDALLDRIRGQEGMELTLEKCDLALAIEATGELLWDQAAGRVHSFSLEGDLGVALARAIDIDMGGEIMALSMDLELEGTLECALATEDGQQE